MSLLSLFRKSYKRFKLIIILIIIPWVIFTGMFFWYDLDAIIVVNFTNTMNLSDQSINWLLASKELIFSIFDTWTYFWGKPSSNLNLLCLTVILLYPIISLIFFLWHPYISVAFTMSLVFVILFLNFAFANNFEVLFDFFGIEIFRILTYDEKYAIYFNWLLSKNYWAPNCFDTHFKTIIETAMTRSDLLYNLDAVYMQLNTPYMNFTRDLYLFVGTVVSAASVFLNNLCVSAGAKCLSLLGSVSKPFISVFGYCGTILKPIGQALFGAIAIFPNISETVQNLGASIYSTVASAPTNITIFMKDAFVLFAISVVKFVKFVKFELYIFPADLFNDYAIKNFEPDLEKFKYSKYKFVHKVAPTNMSPYSSFWFDVGREFLQSNVFADILKTVVNAANESLDPKFGTQVAKDTVNINTNIELNVDSSTIDNTEAFNDLQPAGNNAHNKLPHNYVREPNRHRAFDIDEPD